MNMITNIINNLIFWMTYPMGGRSF
ncbi:uncharacterized protein METZ01_LOCUS125161 [marine metagenome]|uniref:Uncharacterized protein n=1 Tax=marine metagenome TaxID=408172 RepID=A0A381Y7D3_9ZZZZ